MGLLSCVLLDSLKSQGVSLLSFRNTHLHGDHPQKEAASQFENAVNYEELTVSFRQLPMNTGSISLTLRSL
jgi:hypothetical protein